MMISLAKADLSNGWDAWGEVGLLFACSFGGAKPVETYWHQCVPHFFIVIASSGKKLL